MTGSTSADSVSRMFCEDFQPIHFGHHDVEQDKVKGSPGDEIKRSAAGLRFGHPVAASRKPAGQDDAIVLNVVDDKHMNGFVLVRVGLRRVGGVALLIRRPVRGEGGCDAPAGRLRNAICVLDERH